MLAIPRAVRANVFIVAACLVAACSSTTTEVNGGPSGNGGGSSGGEETPPGTFDPATADGGGSSSGSTPCAPNPANVEVPNNGCDDDGDGTVDVVAACDDALGVEDGAESFARALGVCKKASATSWGLVSAKYVSGFTRDAAPADGQHGILSRFGAAVTPREGKTLGLLSTGWAREYNAATSASKKPFNDQPPKAMQEEPVPGFPSVLTARKGEPPPGWPKATAGCPQLSTDTFDMAGVELAIKVPANAKALRFDFDFYSGEWPQWVCSRFNDGFVAMLQSGGKWENVSFDAKGNPVSVNFAFFDRCTPNVKTSCKESTPKTSVCPGGTSELAGTGFAIVDDYCGYGTNSTGGGATGWLVSSAPVAAGETIKLRFLIWDTGDFKFDSTVLLDHLHWETVAPPPAPSTERAPPLR